MKYKSSSFISDNLILNGNIEIKDSIRVDGKIVGVIKSHQTVTVGEDAKVNADIISKNLVASGEINGSIFASGKVHLAHNGKLKGNVKTSDFKLEKTFSFDGFCEIITE